MMRNEINLVRNQRSKKGFLSSNNVGIDGLNAIKSIPGTNEVKIENESKDHVKISFLWSGSEEGFMETEKYLLKYGVMKKL